jgi:CHAD domain-containing protein
MAPVLAGFVADNSDPQTWDDVAAAVLAALAAEFDVAPERGGASAPDGARRTTWLDTFDWRLHKAGLTLEYAPGRRGGELRLTGSGASTDTDNDATQLVTGWQASRPHLLADLAGGPVGVRIAGLVAPRALIPVVTTSTATTVYRLLNEDGKTVARLLIDWPSLPGQLSPGGATPRTPLDARPMAKTAIVSGAHPALPGGTPPRTPRSGSDGEASVSDPQLFPGAGRETGPRQPASLPPRLSIAEVRGYQGEARRAVRLIAAVPGLMPAAEPRLADALRAIGRRRGDYSNKVDANITAGMPAAGAAAAILLRLLDTIDANVAGVLADIDTEFLHDLRVSVRRTRSALKLLGDALAGLTGKEVAFFAAEFKWVGDLTTPTRDLDVHLLDFEETARGLAAAKPDDLEPFRAYLEQRRRKEFRSVARGLRSARFTTLTREWRARLIKVQSDSSGPMRVSRTRSGQFQRAAGGTAGLLAAERTRVAFAKVAKRGAAITRDTPGEALHDLRKRCKELRYSLEFFAPLHDPAGYTKVVGDLKRLQDCLGEFQDTDVQIGEIRALAAAMLAAHEAPAVTLLAMGEITAGLAARQRAARADFERRFAAFADVDGQRRMSALLRGRYRIDADLCVIQHQGRRREDHDGGQPGLPGGRGGAAHRPVGPGPAGRGELHVPGQAEGQGRRQGAHQRQAPARRRHQGNGFRQSRSDPSGLHLPEHGPAARRGRRETRRRPRRQARPQAIEAARAAGGRVRRGVPRLPAVRLAGLGERAARRRRHRGPTDPDDTFRADS